MGINNFLLLAAGSLVLLGLPMVKKRQSQQRILEKLRVVSMALEQAEEQLARSQERHDRILFQMNSQYLSHNEMETALSEARAAMKEALQFFVNLRLLQIQIVRSML